MASPQTGLKFLRSFRLRAILLITLLVGGLQALSTLRIINLQNNALEEIEHTKGELMAEFAARSLEGSLHTQERVQTMRNLEVLRSDPDFASARVIDPSGEIVAHVEGSGTSDPASIHEHTSTLLISAPDGTQTELLVVISRSLSDLHNRQSILTRSKLVGLLFYICAFYLALTLITATFIRPLAQIRASITRIRDGQLSFEIPNLKRHDEVGEVARALEHFRTNAIEMRALREGREHRARQTRHRILRALEATQDAVLILSDAGLVEFANPRAQAYFQHAVQSGAELFTHVVDPEHRAQIEAAVATGAAIDLTTDIRIDETDLDVADYPEEQLPVAMRINPIIDDEGRCIGTVILVTDNSMQERVASRIQRLADFDSLTGLYNRRVLEERLDDRLAEQPDDVALILLDLDRFKTINDTLGHPVGDELLAHIAGLLRDTSTSRDLAARMGGDEFAIVVTGHAAESRAQAMAGQIVAQLSKPVQVNNRALQSGASIGIATAQSDTSTAQDMIRNADLALYAAKHQGRGRAVRFEPYMEQDVQRKSQVEFALRRALFQKKVTAHFQRQSALADNRLTGFEALARWDDPDLGIVSPGEFIPVAEETGLIRELTIQMLALACDFIVKCQALGFNGTISVNISPHLFADDVTELISDSLLVSGCPPQALVVEITEAVFLAQGNDAKNQIRTLQDMGVTVALDDFGMGFSSLSYLQRFPVNNIKIDRAFVSRVTESPQTAAIVRAIVELGHALDMTVTAEGVETEDQRIALRRSGADSIQGFIDGKPMPFDNALEVVAEELDGVPARQA